MPRNSGARERDDPPGHAGSGDHAGVRRQHAAPPRGAGHGRRRRPDAPAADRERGLRDPQGGARRSPAARGRWHRQARSRPDRLLAQGRNRQDRDLDEPRHRVREAEKLRTLLLDLDLKFGDAAIMLGLEPDKTIYDLVVARANKTREAGRLHPAGTLRGSTSSPRRFGPRRRARHRGEGQPAARGRTRFVRHHRRRHVAVLPRPDARDAGPHSTSCSCSCGLGHSRP